MILRRVVWTVLGVGSLVAMSAPAYADVVTTSGPGKPIYAESNTGSPQATMHRSATGATNKFTHDGRVYIWDE